MNTRVAAVAELERRIGHTFQDRELLERALTHGSVTKGSSRLRDNERLEFLGDRVLNLVTAERIIAPPTPPGSPQLEPAGQLPRLRRVCPPRLPA